MFLVRETTVILLDFAQNVAISVQHSNKFESETRTTHYSFSMIELQKYIPCHEMSVTCTILYLLSVVIVYILFDFPKGNSTEILRIMSLTLHQIMSLRDGHRNMYFFFSRSEERREGKSVDLGGRRIIKKKKKQIREYKARATSAT